MGPEDLDKIGRVDWYCLVVTASVSLVACVYMLVTYAMFPKVRTAAMNIVMLQTLAEITVCLSLNLAFVNVPTTGSPTCRFHGWFLNFSVLSSLFFTASISGYMNTTIRRQRKIEFTHKHLAILAIVVVSVAGGLAAFPFITDQYVQLGAHCWIAEDEEGRDRMAGVLYRMLTHYGVIWAANAYIAISYYSVFQYLVATSRQLQSNANQEHIFKTVKILMYYPVICFMAWIPHTVLRIYTAVNPDKNFPSFALGLAHVILLLEGTFFAVAFSQYRAVRVEWTRYIWGDAAAASLLTGQASSSGINSNVSNVNANGKDNTASRKQVFSTGIDITMVDDLADEEEGIGMRRTSTQTGRNVAHSEFQDEDLQMRNTE